MNVGQALEASPQDHVARRRVAGASQVAAELGDFNDALGNRWWALGFPPMSQTLQ